MYIDVTLEGSRFDRIKASKASLVTAEFAHPLLAVEINDLPLADRRFRTGAPITVAAGDDRRSFQFHGYVNHLKPLHSGDRTSGTVYCVGLSWPMNTEVSRRYFNQSVPSVVADVALANRLALHTRSHPQVWSSLSSTGKSDWSFLCSMARKIGWSLWLDGAELQLLPYDVVLDRDTAAVIGPERGLLGFHAEVGETTPRGGFKANRTVGGINPRTGLVFSSSDTSTGAIRLGNEVDDPLFTRISTDLVVHDGVAATQQIQAAGSEHRWHQQGKALVLGDPGIHVGTTVFLDTNDPRPRGYWLVQKATHTVTGESFTSELGIGRDAQYDFQQAPVVGRRRAKIVVQNANDGFANNRVVLPTLNNGTWQADIGRIRGV